MKRRLAASQDAAKPDHDERWRRAATGGCFALDDPWTHGSCCQMGCGGGSHRGRAKESTARLGRAQIKLEELIEVARTVVAEDLAGFETMAAVQSQGGLEGGAAAGLQQDPSVATRTR